MKIKFELIEDVIKFTTACERYYKGLVFAEQNEQKINAKSLLAIYILDLSKPIYVHIDTDNRNEKDDFYNFVEQWKVED